VEDKDALFKEVFSHLAKVEDQPSSQVLDAELLKRAERSLDTSTPKELLWRLLGTGERLLQTLQQDPTPLTRLLERDVLLTPFDELKTSISAEKLEEGLTSASIPIQLLCLAYLRKAADTPSGASFVASSSTLVQTLFTTWLASESTEVAERALEDIVALLAVDNIENVTRIAVETSLGEAFGHGLLWRRVFHDPEVYSLMFDWTSLVRPKRDTTSKKGLQLTTISQARLFDFITRLAPLDWAALTTSTLPEIEALHILENDDPQPYGGLLRYAASHMIDASDYLMEVLRQDFFVKLLAVIEEVNGQHVSPRLLEAIQLGAGVDSTRPAEEDGMYL